MAQQTINVGTAPNDGTGTPLRTAFQYTNSNFSELYTAVGPSGNNIVVPGNATISGTLTANGNISMANATSIFSSGAVALYVDTNQLVLRARATNGILFQESTGANNLLTISNAGVFGFLDGAGGTRMTLNSTGLGVGVSPGSAIGNLQVGGSSNANLYVQQGTDTIRMGVRASGRTGIIFDSSNATYTNRAWYLDNVGSSGSLIIGRQGLDVITFDNSGNCGIGITPSAWRSTNKALQVGSYSSLTSSSAGDLQLFNNAYINSGGANIYQSNGFATRYEQYQGVHAWYSAPSGTAGNTATFTQAMTLDASGRLFVGATSITAGYTGNNYFVVGGVTSPTIKLQSTTGPAAWDIYSAGGADLFVAYNASDKGQFNSSTGVYTALSDANKKKDFEPSNIGLAEVLKLKPTLFRMIGAADDSAKELGFVAQDVQSVIPQAYVETESQGGKFIGLQDRPIIAALTRAIQELTARVEALEA